MRSKRPRSAHPPAPQDDLIWPCIDESPIPSPYSSSGQNIASLRETPHPLERRGQSYDTCHSPLPQPPCRPHQLRPLRSHGAARADRARKRTRHSQIGITGPHQLRAKHHHPQGQLGLLPKATIDLLPHSRMTWLMSPPKISRHRMLRGRSHLNVKWSKIGQQQADPGGQSPRETHAARHREAATVLRSPDPAVILNDRRMQRIREHRVRLPPPAELQRNELPSAYKQGSGYLARPSALAVWAKSR